MSSGRPRAQARWEFWLASGRAGRGLPPSLGGTHVGWMQWSPVALSMSQTSSPCPLQLALPEWASCPQSSGGNSLVLRTCLACCPPHRGLETRDIRASPSLKAVGAYEVMLSHPQGPNHTPGWSLASLGVPAGPGAVSSEDISLPTAARPGQIAGGQS